MNSAKDSRAPAASEAARRVAITGIGMVTPLGLDTSSSWAALLAGSSGIGPVTRVDTSDLPVKIAGEVRDFDPARYMDKKSARRSDRYTQFAVAAARMAVADAKLHSADLVDAGCMIGSAFGGLTTLEEQSHLLWSRGVDRLSPHFIPMALVNMASGVVAIELGARGLNVATVSACASGAHAIGEAARAIKQGAADIVIAGGSEAAITMLGLGGFSAARALSTRPCPPAEASCPFDLRRDGFVMAEGAGILVLERLDHARARGAVIYAEVTGYASTADAYHMTHPPEGGEGAGRALRAALAEAGVAPQAVDYINAHGTSTPAGDAAESAAIARVFADAAPDPAALAQGDAGAYAGPAVSSTKSMTGHLLGAAGAVETGICALALHHGVMPPTLNYGDPDPACAIDVVGPEPRRGKLQVAINNAFGFGGHNAVLVLQQPAAPGRSSAAPRLCDRRD